MYKKARVYRLQRLIPENEYRHVGNLAYLISVLRREYPVSRKAVRRGRRHRRHPRFLLARRRRRGRG